MKNIKYTVLFFAVVLNFFDCGANSKNEKRAFFEESGGYSIIIPKVWEARETPGLKYKVFVGQTEHNFTQNINFVDEAFGGDLNFYVDAAIGQLVNLFGENFVLIQRSDFTTLRNLEGEKLVTTISQYNRNIRQVIYCFPGDGKKILATCSVSAESGASYDAFFDSIMETFEWAK
jgi:hypothetical protein